MNDFLRLVPLSLSRRTPPRPVAPVRELPTAPVQVELSYDPDGFFKTALADTVARWQDELTTYDVAPAAVGGRHVERVIFADQTMAYQPPPPPVRPPVTATPPSGSEPAEWWD
jgi:hypothetical protein